MYNLYIISKRLLPDGGTFFGIGPMAGLRAGISLVSTSALFLTN